MQQTKQETSTTPTRDWLRVLAQYREPSHIRSFVELGITGVSFIVLWGAAWWALSVSYWLTLAITIPAAAFLVRLFLIQHDSGHGAFFRRRFLNDWLGRAIGILTFTPYDVWRHSHAVHHATSGNLDKRGVGDIDTITVQEYQALPRAGRIVYRLYRNPMVMFGLGPAYHFLLRNRLPDVLGSTEWRPWVSAMGTNVGMALIAGTAIYFLGAGPFLAVQLPIILLASSIGVWLFYVQHQFEDTYWATDKAWDLPEAALVGSSYYHLPGILSWVTANIGVHHVHHLSSRIPFYRLREVLRDHPELATRNRLTIWQSLACTRLRLWDESRKKLVSFSESRK